MAEVGNLTVKVGIDGASKAVQDLEKIRRQLELINTLARNVAASFATVNTQLRTFDNITRSMDNATRSGERYNYTLRNTARIIGDFSRGQAGRGIGNTLQTLAAGKVLSGSGFNRDFGRLFTAFRRATGGESGIGDAAVGAYEQGLLKRQLAFQRTDFGKELTRSALFQRLGYTPVQRNAGGPGRGLLGGGFGLPSGIANYAANFGNRLTQNGVMSALNTSTGGFGGGFSLTGIAGIAGSAGLFAATIGALVGYMKLLSTAVLNGAQAMAGFVKTAVQIGADFQSLRSANTSIILGTQYGGDISKLGKARATSNQEFAYMRTIAEKSMYTLPEIAGAANVLKTGKIPLNGFLNTVAQTGQAVGLKGNELQLLARVFQRLAYGDYPDPEVAARFGLTRTNPELKKYGLTFDKEGKLTTPTPAAVNGIKKYLDKIFGAGFIISANDFNTKFASLTDRFQGSLEKLATPIMNSLIPLFDSLGNRLNEFASKDWFSTLGDSIASFFDQINTYVKSPSFVQDSAMFFAVLEEIPNQMKAFFSFFIKTTGILTQLARDINAGKMSPNELFGTAAMNILSLGIYGQAEYAMTKNDPSAKRRAQGRVARSYGNPLGWLSDLYEVGVDIASSQISAPNTVSTNYEKYLNLFAMSRKGKKTTKDGLMDKPYTGDDMLKAQEEGNKKLKQLVDNSKKLVDLFDLRRQTIGLGPLSQIGVTGVELAAAGMPMINSHKIDPSNYNSISIGPVRGVNQLEKGINALNRENQNKAKAGRGIRTSR